MKDLPKRTLTAIIFGAVMLGGLNWSRLTFSVLVLVIQSGCLYEYLKLVRKFQHYQQGKEKISFAVTMLLSSSILVALIVQQTNFISMAYGIFLIPVCFILLAAELIYQSETPFINGLLNAGATLYISLPMVFFYSLADNAMFAEQQPWFQNLNVVPLGVVLIIWANDTFAYFTGSLLGKHKILPAVSPKKSWEGFFGGLIFALVAAAALSHYYTKLDLQQWLIVATIVVVFGTTGDFFESMIKRQAGVKDSGNFLPGHGGFLDRFDALLFCVPFVTIYLMIAQ